MRLLETYRDGTDFDYRDSHLMTDQSIGMDGNGRLLELVSIRNNAGQWLIYHAMTPRLYDEELETIAFPKSRVNAIDAKAKRNGETRKRNGETRSQSLRQAVDNALLADA